MRGCVPAAPVPPWAGEGWGARQQPAWFLRLSAQNPAEEPGVDEGYGSPGRTLLSQRHGRKTSLSPHPFPGASGPRLVR
ncbi:uncharacterized protein LOC118256623 isoform X3 [Cygnus atratus]|nr:uncharacterized protein LOC118256623 isoform X3 [Cygnus atratus]